MTPISTRRAWSRTLPATVLLAFGLTGYAAPAHAATTPSATIGAVTCGGDDGQVEVALHAADGAPTTFLVLLDGEAVGADDGTTVPAGASSTVTVPGLEDDDHTVDVLDISSGGDEPGSDDNLTEPGATPSDEAAPDEAAPDEAADEGADDVTVPDDVVSDDPADDEADEADEADTSTLATAEITVACDTAPEGPYSNAHGTVDDGCGSLSVTARNKPIGGNVADLQPVTFTLSIDHGGEVEVLDTFVLDAATRTYARDFASDELGGAGAVTLTADGTQLARAEFTDECVAYPMSSAASGGTDTGSGVSPEAVQHGVAAAGATTPSALPDTGASPHQLLLTALGALLVLLGTALVRAGRVLPRHRV